MFNGVFNGLAALHAEPTIGRKGIVQVCAVVSQGPADRGKGTQEESPRESASGSSCPAMCLGERPVGGRYVVYVLTGFADFGRREPRVYVGSCERGSSRHSPRVGGGTKWVPFPDSRGPVEVWSTDKLPEVGGSGVSRFFVLFFESFFFFCNLLPSPSRPSRSSCSSGARN